MARVFVAALAAALCTWGIRAHAGGIPSCTALALGELGMGSGSSGDIPDDLRTALMRIELTSDSASQEVKDLLAKRKKGLLTNPELLDALRKFEPAAEDWVFACDIMGKRFSLNDILRRLEAPSADVKEAFEENLNMFQVASIRGTNSRQLSRKSFAPQAVREIYWTIGTLPRISDGFGNLLLISPRISVIKLNGKPEVIEALIPDKKRKIWIPRLYENQGGRWVKVNRTRTGDDLNHCFGCHGSGENFGPIPFKNKTYTPALGWFETEEQVKAGHKFFPWNSSMPDFHKTVTHDPVWGRDH